MNDEQLEHFRQRLLTRRDEFRQREAEGDEAADTVILDQQSVGRLSRMEADEHGYCMACGDDMDPRRLEVDPSHTHCVACASSA